MSSNTMFGAPKVLVSPFKTGNGNKMMFGRWFHNNIEKSWCRIMCKQDTYGWIGPRSLLSFQARRRRGAWLSTRVKHVWKTDVGNGRWSEHVQGEHHYINYSHKPTVLYIKNLLRNNNNNYNKVASWLCSSDLCH